MEHTDFALAFTDGATVSDAQGTLATMRLAPLGDLAVPTGQLVACDPLASIEPKPFALRVAPGRYATVASVAALSNGDERIACVMLRLREAPVARWELARLAGQEEITLGAGEFFGYPVDAGVGCFMDAQAAAALAARYEADESYDEAVIDALETNRSLGWDYANLMLDDTNGLNVILFASGWGDGVYASYWGYDANDANDAPVCLVTDFGVL